MNQTTYTPAQWVYAVMWTQDRNRCLSIYSTREAANVFASSLDASFCAQVEEQAVYGQSFAQAASKAP